jgi:hypothetical protein
MIFWICCIIWLLMGIIPTILDTIEQHKIRNLYVLDLFFIFILNLGGIVTTFWFLVEHHIEDMVILKKKGS